MLWSKELLDYKGFPRPFFYPHKVWHFKNNKRFLANKVPVPYQSLPGDEITPIKLNIQHEEEVVENNLCPYCGNIIKDFDISIRWAVEREKDKLREERDLVPSDFHPFHKDCMKQARIFCPFMRTLSDEQFEIKENKDNLKEAKNYIKEYFKIKWKNKSRRT